MSKIKYWDKLKNSIERGKQGLNTGIPFGNFTTLSNHIMNIQQGRYDLVFAGTSVGKSAFIDSTYVFGAIDFLQANPGYIHDLEIIYYSLEIKPEDQIAKHIARLIWEEYGILTDTNEILSRGNKHIRPELENIINSYEERLNEIQNKYIHYRSSLNPDFLYKDLIGYAEKRGTVIRNTEGLILDYKPNNPALITLVIIDHIGLIDLGKYNNLKEAIDKCSKTLVFFRNMFNFSPLVVSQINRSQEGMDRKEGDNWMPMLSDIKNSGGPSEDSNTVIGLAAPFYYGVEKCLGYDISKYKNRYRLAKVCKNRDGDVNKLASFLFIGEIGKYAQLPRAEEQVGKPEELKRIDEYYAKRQNGK
jgi:replicative DNA helicase